MVIWQDLGGLFHVKSYTTLSGLS